MSKALKRLAPALAAAALCALAASAQTTLEWIVLSPAREKFAALAPGEPSRLEQAVRAGELEAAGVRYTSAAEGGARYVVWSLDDPKETGERLKEVSYEGWDGAGRSRHLDLVADAAWELLVKPEVERLEAEARRTGVRKMFSPSLMFTRTLDINGRRAREYALRLEGEGGPVYVCADGRRLYVVAALAPDPKAADSRRFVESFAVGTKTPNSPGRVAPRDPSPPQAGDSTAAPGEGVGAGGPPDSTPNAGGGDAPPDDARPFRQSEVTKRAVITLKAEPGFTDSARRFEVTGTVRLRAVLHKSGQVTGVSVVTSLPHGLTEKAIEATKRMRFEPAQKDGRAVSQYVVLEYNYQIF